MKTDQPLPALVVINGGVEIEVTKLDGAKEKVTVRLLPITKIGEYFEKSGEIAKFVSLLCNKPFEWVESLNPDSVFEIDDIGRKINDPIADRLVARQTSTVAKIKQTAKNATGLIESSQTQ